MDDVIITDHAVDRFYERCPTVGTHDTDRLRNILRAELRRSVPFGSLLGADEMRLLPCGLVGIVERDDAEVLLVTVLTQQLAIANMQSRGVALKASPMVPPPRWSTTEGLEELRSLAEKHVKHGAGRRTRNNDLRALNIDPAGPAGDRYRQFLNEQRMALYAEIRRAFLAERAADSGGHNGTCGSSDDRKDGT